MEARLAYKWDVNGSLPTAHPYANSAPPNYPPGATFYLEDNGTLRTTTTFDYETDDRTTPSPSVQPTITMHPSTKISLSRNQCGGGSGWGRHGGPLRSETSMGTVLAMPMKSLMVPTPSIPIRWPMPHPLCLNLAM